MIAGNAALQDGFDEAARVFQKERVRQARRSAKNELSKVEALTWLALFQHREADDRRLWLVKRSRATHWQSSWQAAPSSRRT